MNDARRFLACPACGRQSREASGPAFNCPIDRTLFAALQRAFALDRQNRSIGTATLYGIRFHPFLAAREARCHSAPGTIRLLGESDTQRISSVELDRIREGLANGRRLRPHIGVPIGTQVRIRSGVFEGVLGVVTELRQHCKVVIGLAAIQQSFSLEVSIDEVEVMEQIIAQPVGAWSPMRLARL